MTYTQAHAAIKAYCIASVQTAWPTVTKVIGERPELENSASNIAYVYANYPRTSSPQFVDDEIVFSFSIVGRFDRPAASSMEAAIVDKQSAIRTTLYATTNPGTYGYLTNVASFDVDFGGDPIDGYYETGVTFECTVQVTR